MDAQTDRPRPWLGLYAQEVEDAIIVAASPSAVRGKGRIAAWGSILSRAVRIR